MRSKYLLTMKEEIVIIWNHNLEEVFLTRVCWQFTDAKVRSFSISQTERRNLKFIEITESTLYPILKRLEASNQLEVFTQEHNGRLRKYYRITAAGKERITQLMSEWEEIVKVYQFIQKERCESHE